jgi:hypothetical protein
MGAGFGEYGNPPVARLGNIAEGFRGRYMHHIEGRFGQLGDADSPVGGFALGGRGARQGVKDGIVVAGGDGFFDQGVDDQAVFRMDAGQRPVGAGHTQYLQKLAVIDEQLAGAHHEHLETNDTVAVQQRFHIGQGLVAEIDDNHMRGHIDGGARRTAAPVGKAGDRAIALGLLGVIHQGLGAAEGRRHGAGLEAIDRVGQPDGGFQMGMHIDAAGHYQQPAGVVDFGVFSDFDLGADHRHPAIPDEDIGAVIVGGGNDATVAD